MGSLLWTVGGLVGIWLRCVLGLIGLRGVIDLYGGIISEIPR